MTKKRVPADRFHGSLNAGDVEDEVQRRRSGRGPTTSAWQRKLDAAVRRYMASHPGVSRSEAIVAVLRQQKLVASGGINAAIARAREQERKKELRARAAAERKKARRR